MGDVLGCKVMKCSLDRAGSTPVGILKCPRIPVVTTLQRKEEGEVSSYRPCLGPSLTSVATLGGCSDLPVLGC